MNKTYKKIWLKALRSGEYAQGYGHLAQNSGEPFDRFSCLGVLIDVTVGFDEAPDVGSFGYVSAPNGGLVYAASLPPELVERFGIPPRAVTVLLDFNDLHGWSFEQIADWIEENL